MLIEMPFMAYDGNSEPSSFLNASISEFGSSDEESIYTDPTITDSDMSDYERHIIHNRFSGPQFVDQWSIYVLGRKTSYRTGQVRDGWIWKRALTCPATMTQRHSVREAGRQTDRQTD